MRFSIKSVKSLSSEGLDRSGQTLDTSPPASIGLTVLYPNGDDSAALVDIITVHGLADHPQNTWTNFASQHYWPSKSLPEDMPKSRIMAFGYSTSNSPFQKSTAIISDIAKQLLSHLINKRKSKAQKKKAYHLCGTLAWWHCDQRCSVDIFLLSFHLHLILRIAFLILACRLKYRP